MPGVLAVRIGAAYTEDGGFVDRVANGQGTLLALAGGLFQSFNTAVDHNVNTYKTAAARASVAYSPSDAFSITLDTYYQERHTADSGEFWPNLPRFEQSNAVAEPVRDRTAFPDSYHQGRL